MIDFHVAEDVEAGGPQAFYGGVGTVEAENQGGAVTAAVSQAARDAGAAEVVLFTDLANPTSNALYQRLGYEAVSDRVIFSFGK